MNNVDRDIQRKYGSQARRADRRRFQDLPVFWDGRASFYRWRAAFQRQGKAGLVKRKPVPRNPANRTPPEIVERVHICGGLTTWRIRSSGIWRAITTSRSRMPASSHSQA